MFIVWINVKFEKKSSHKLTANVNENMKEIDIGHMIKNVIEYGCNFPEKSIDFLSI